MTRVNMLLAASAAVALTGCESAPIRREAGGAPDRNVDLMAVAPDGTQLWRFNDSGRTVYFASSGAQWTRHCGKNCSRKVQVPTADPLQAAGQ